MEDEIKIVIADDHEMLRKGIEVLLTGQRHIQIVAQAAHGKELVEKVKIYHPQVVITDIQMPEMNGIEATKKIIQMKEDVGVIALSMFNEDHLIIEMLEAGARGYLLKNTNRDELLDAIHAVADGGTYICNSTSQKMTHLIASSKFRSFNRLLRPELTEKEKEIIRMICKEYSSKQIAAALGYTTRTVENYREKIQQKIGAKNMAGVVVFAIKHKIFEPS